MFRLSVRQSLNWRSFCLLFVWLVICIMTHPIWFSSGYIIFSDLDFGINDVDYFQRIFGLFNESMSSMNFYNLSRLTFMVPFYGLALLFGDLVPHLVLKAMVLFILLFSATGMFKLCEHLLFRHFGQFRDRFHYIGLTIPALYYVLNPWVMFRIQHIFLLVGYACFPWVLRYFFDLFNVERRDESHEREIRLCGWKWKMEGKRWNELKAILLIAFFVNLGSAAIHYFFYYIIALLWLSLFIIIHQVRGSQAKLSILKDYIRKNVWLYGTILLFCSYWLWTDISSTLVTNIEPQNVNVVDTLQMFSRYSTLRNVLYMVSYWWPMFEMDKYLGTPFWVGGGVFLGIMAFAVFYRYGWHFYVKLFTWSAALMVLIALGVNQNWISDLNVLIVTKVPLIGQIFRDPNKLIGPMALFFAVLIAFGVDKLIFFLREAGFNRYIQTMFGISLVVSLFFFYQPFYYIFTKGYYAGVNIPQEYKEIQNQYLPDGKIAWVPTMGNMQISNGVTGYTWNEGDILPGKLKLAGDFQVYASEKPTLFQNENNHGIISYFHSFIQSSLDKGDAQHLGKLFAWAGYNEVGFHKDVFGQEERQAFNKTILDNQTDLVSRKQDSIFTLYNTPLNAQKVTDVNRIAYVTKGMNGFSYMLDYEHELDLDVNRTGLVWAPLRKQTVNLSNQDLLVGDDKWDFILPQLDDKYVYYPFDHINTGNPYTGWSKTLTKEADWFWTLKVNNIPDNDWGYDYGRGVGYTYTPYKLSIPSYKLDQELGTKLLGMDALLNGFFQQENPDIFKLTAFPNQDKNGPALAGVVEKGSVESNIWQVARSKRVGLNGGRFIRIQGLVSGINASSLHFKVHFFNQKNEEIKVAYVTTADDMADTTRSSMMGDFYVPQDTRYMYIDILSQQSTKNPVYFWIHDFSIYPIEDSSQPNAIDIPIEKAEGPYHVFARVYKSPASGAATIQTQEKSVPLDMHDSLNQFQWVDLGEMAIPNQKLSLIPGEGLNVINAVVAIPVTEFNKEYSKILNQIKGKQADFSLLKQDFELHTDIPMLGLEKEHSSINSIGNSLLPVHQGSFTKKVDILNEDEYRFSFTGYLPDTSDMTLVIRDQAGNEMRYPKAQWSVSSLPRVFQDTHAEIQDEKNKYFLHLMPNENNRWEIKRFDGPAVRLKPGAYQVELQFNSNTPNLTDMQSLHPLNPEEIILPKETTEEEDQAVVLFKLLQDKQYFSITKDNNQQTPTFSNSKTNAQNWIIYALNKVPVKKGETIVFRAYSKSDGIHDLHGKLMFMNNESVLQETKFIDPTGGDTKEYYIITKAKQDGYIQPTFFMHGDPKLAGQFSLMKAEFYTIDNMAKTEGISMYPTELSTISSSSSSASDGTRYLMDEEAFNPVWRYQGTGSQEPIAMNLMHNAFAVNGQKTTGKFVITYWLQIPYYLGLFTTFVLHVLLLMVLRRD